MKYEYNKQSLLKKLISLRGGFIARDKREVDEWNAKVKEQWDARFSMKIKYEDLYNSLPSDWYKPFIKEVYTKVGEGAWWDIKENVIVLDIDASNKYLEKLDNNLYLTEYNMDRYISRLGLNYDDKISHANITGCKVVTHYFGVWEVEDAEYTLRAVNLPVVENGHSYTTPHDLNNLISLLQSAPDEITSITLEQKDLEIMKKYEV